MVKLTRVFHRSKPVFVRILYGAVGYAQTICHTNFLSLCSGYMPIIEFVYMWGKKSRATSRISQLNSEIYARTPAQPTTPTPPHAYPPLYRPPRANRQPPQPNKEHTMPSLPKKSVRIAPDTTLSKAERSEALHSVRTILDTVSTDWVFTPPPPPTFGQTSKFALQRSGSLGSWRPNAANSPPATPCASDSDSEDAGSDSSLDLDLDLEDSIGTSSYRRALTPPPRPKRAKRRDAKALKEGVWRRREDDSDVDALNIVKRESESGKYPFESPDDVPTPEKLRERLKREMEAEMTWNDGLRLFVARRDAWTGAVGDEVPVRESRFKDVLITFPHPSFLPHFLC